MKATWKRESLTSLINKVTKRVDKCRELIEVAKAQLEIEVAEYNALGWWKRWNTYQPDTWTGASDAYEDVLRYRQWGWKLKALLEVLTTARLNGSDAVTLSNEELQLLHYTDGL
jgi:hypothetical protein